MIILEEYLMKYKTLTCAIAMSVGILTVPLALADLNDGLVAYYPFNGNANDASGNGLNGTVNGATLTEDKLSTPNSAYYFDGKGFINLGNSSLFDVNHHTITAWVKGEDLHLKRPNVILGKVIPGVHEAIMLSLKQNQLATNFATGTEINHGLLGSIEFESNQWYFVALTYDGKMATLYVDGNVDSRFPRTGTVRTNTINLAIGKHYGEDKPSQNGHDFFFHGSIDDLRIYKRALSEDEIQTLYTGESEDGDCKHATYSPKKRTLTVPFVEMPVIDFLTGQPTGELELWTGNLKQVRGTTNRFVVLRKTVTQITDGSSSSCPATYAVETGTLSIPYIDVPIGITVGNREFENGVEVFKATMTWEPMGKSFVVQDVEKRSSIPNLFKSCAEIKAKDSSASDGIYEIDPDGTGGNQPFKVYCDMTTDNGGWTLIFRHDASEGYFAGIDEAANINQDKPGLSTKKYSILNQLEAFKKDGQFQFRINWPGYTERNIWSQTSNPTEDVDVAGYQDISVDSTSNYWGGLEFGNGSHGPNNYDGSYLDGSVNHENWFYAIGLYRQWGNTEGCYNVIPAADIVAGNFCGVQTVELWVK